MAPLKQHLLQLLAPVDGFAAEPSPVAGVTCEVQRLADLVKLAMAQL